MSSAVVVGGGLGGLAAAGLLARAGLRVTLLEAASHLGGKSRRLTLAGQRIDTGPEFLTFLGIWEEYLRRWDGREDVGRAARIAGLAKLTAKGYLDGLSWLPDGLREVIAVHALDGGSGPRNTPALYAAMPAVIAEEGAWVPQGGLHELILALARLAEAAGAELRTGGSVERVEQGRVFAGG